jgi:hypothetical protein
MIIAAIWVLEQEAAWAKRNFAHSDHSQDSAALMIGLTSFGVVQSSAISMTPYYSIYRQAERFRWVADDMAWRAKHPFWSKIWPFTIHNYHPKLLAFARKGGARAIAVRVGSRFIPYVGWALLGYDLWNVGKWIGEKTS